MKKGGRKVITIKRPVVPHLHFVDLRKEEKIVDKALFNEGEEDEGEKKDPKRYTMIKTIEYWSGCTPKF